jgi:HrpA-like RNA helicase
MLSVDSFAQGITHIILDEVHERETNTDYLLIVLREALAKRDGLKLILMSATIEGNKDLFLGYFKKYQCGTCDSKSLNN